MNRENRHKVTAFLAVLMFIAPAIMAIPHIHNDENDPKVVEMPLDVSNTTNKSQWLYDKSTINLLVNFAMLVVSIISTIIVWKTYRHTR